MGNFLRQYMVDYLKAQLDAGNPVLKKVGWKRSERKENPQGMPEHVRKMLGIEIKSWQEKYKELKAQGKDFRFLPHPTETVEQIRSWAKRPEEEPLPILKRKADPIDKTVKKEKKIYSPKISLPLTPLKFTNNMEVDDLPVATSPDKPQPPLSKPLRSILRNPISETEKIWGMINYRNTCWFNSVLQLFAELGIRTKVRFVNDLIQSLRESQPTETMHRLAVKATAYSKDLFTNSAYADPMEYIDHLFEKQLIDSNDFSFEVGFDQCACSTLSPPKFFNFMFISDFIADKKNVIDA